MPDAPDLQRLVAAALRDHGTVHLADALPDEYDCCAEAVLAALGLGCAADGTHLYLSTGCLHGEHGYCQSNTGLGGAKKPASCKFCAAPCLCPCHVTGQP